MPDVNARLLVLLQAAYETENADLTTLVRRVLDESGPDATAVFKFLVFLASLPPE